MYVTVHPAIFLTLFQVAAVFVVVLYGFRDTELGLVELD